MRQRASDANPPGSEDLYDYATEIHTLVASTTAPPTGSGQADAPDDGTTPADMMPAIVAHIEALTWATRWQRDRIAQLDQVADAARTWREMRRTESATKPKAASAALLAAVEQLDQAAAGHDWQPAEDLGGIPACRRCGVVRRRDGRHGPCRGPRALALRQDDPPANPQHHQLGEPAWIDYDREWRVECACGEVFGAGDEEDAADLMELHIRSAED